MNKVARYRRHAGSCRELASRARCEEQRRLLLEAAYHWEALAGLHERFATRLSPTS